jgi:hypothetical protein
VLAFWGVLVACQLFGSTLCVAVAAVTRKQSLSMAVLSMLLLIFASTSGFIITTDW